MKRQLLLQEVNNLLLQADITRRESELYQFQETRRSVQLKRWNTYHGGNLESRPRVACRREYDDKTLLHRFVSMKERSKEIYSDPDSQSAQEAALSDTTGRSLGAFKSNLAGSLTEVRLEGDSPRAVLNNSTPELHFRSTSTPFIDSLAMEDREAGASPLGPVRTAPEGETQISTPVSTLGHTDAETISRIPDGASEETDYVSPVSHSVQDPDQSHLQISFTISLATMNVQMPQTIATSTHEPTSINSQCMLCKTASSAQRHATSTTPGPGLDPAKVSVDSSTADHINKFHQGETLADWLKREPKCPELLLPESSPDLEGMTTVKPLFVDETPSASAIPPGGEQSVSKPKEPVPYKKSALKKSKAAPLAKSEDLSDKSKATRQETEGSEWTSQSSLIGPWAPPTERSSHVPQTTLNVSTEKQTLKELKPKHEKTTKTEKIGPFSETPLLKLSRSTSPSSQTSVCPPQVGIVSPIRRLKPATELLEECQKYRMGHTAYRTRSHLRGARTEDVDKKPPQEASAKKTQDKENMSEGFVHVLAKRLSDEEMPTPSAGSNDSTPKAGSVISLHHSDSPHSLTEIGYHIVCNIPSGQSEPTLLSQQSTQVQTAKAGAPLKEVTKGEKVKSVKIVNGKGTTQESSTTMPTRRRSFEIPKSSEFQPEYQAQSSSSTNLDGRTIDEGKPDSTISVSNSFSMPVLSSAEVQGDGARSRSATCSALSELFSAQSTETIASESEKLTIPSERDITTREVVGSSVFYKISSPQVSKSSKSFSGEAEDSPKSQSKQSEHVRMPSPTSSDRRTGKKKKGTIGELCKQSMSFDLGISTSTPKEMRAEKGSEKSGSQSLEGAACKSTFEPLEAVGCEGEESLSSQQSDEKRKPRSRFFDSNWFQKSKKLFKVSK